MRRKSSASADPKRRRKKHVEIPTFPRSVMHSAWWTLLPPVVLGFLVWGIAAKAGLEPRMQLGWEGVVMETIGFLLIVALHKLVLWNPTVEFVSDYARDDRWGILMDWSFACMGLGTIALGFGTHLAYGVTWFSWLLVGSGIAVLLMSLFVADAFTVRKMLRMDPKTQKQTISGMLHDLFAAIAFAGAIVAMLWFCIQPGGSLPSVIRWLQPASFGVFSLAVVWLLAYGFMGISKPDGRELPMGLAERLLIVTIFQWLGIVAATVLYVSPGR